MRYLTASLALAAALASTTPALADTCHFDGRRWICVQAYGNGEDLGQFIWDRYRKAVERALTPRGGWRQQGMLVPPQSVPPAAPAPPPVAAPAPPAQQPTQQQWKDAIIAEAQRFCDSYPSDPICHFQDQAPPAPPR